MVKSGNRLVVDGARLPIWLDKLTPWVRIPLTAQVHSFKKLKN